MKSESPFSNLPSVSELLRHPKVRGLVARLNQTTVAQRATGFLDELRSGVSRAADRGIVPSINQLAEGLARRLLGESPHGGPLVNATGVVLGDQGLAMPIAESALHAVLRSAGEYEDPNAVSQRTIAALCDLTGAESAWIGASVAAAQHLVGQQALENVDLAGDAGLVDPKEFGLASIETVPARLAAGATVVVFDGAGMLGGPACGIVVGGKEAVATLAGDPLATVLAAPPLELVALEATLAIYRDDERVHFQVPVLQLLSTPLENLQQRAERLAVLINECPTVASADARSDHSPWYVTATHHLESATWSIAVEPNDRTVEALGEQLEAGVPSVIAREESGRLVFDLRTVFPRWDQQLLQAIENAEPL